MLFYDFMPRKTHEIGIYALSKNNVIVIDNANLNAAFAKKWS